MKKAMFPLIEKFKGTITYEARFVKRLYGDIYIGDAQRNFYIDRWHEINLCVHYNTRIPGRYAFDGIYHYYWTDGRKSESLHGKLGAIEKEDIIEEYTSLEEAKGSKYYKDFCELKMMIDKEIERQQKINIGSLRCGSQCARYDSNGDEYYLL